MENWGQFVWTVIASSAGTAVLLAALAWLCKGQISHWLNKDLEAAKARHQRELEAYKVSLIAAAERTKAEQEIKTAKALRIVEKQFAAIDRLHRAVLPQAARASSFMRVVGSNRNKEIGEINELMAELTDAIRQASVFLSPPEVDVLHELQEAFGDAIESSYLLKEPLSSSEIDALEEPLLLLQKKANSILQRHMNSMLEMS